MECFTESALIILKNKTKISDLEAEKERLKGLIEGSFKSGWRNGYSLLTEIDEVWEGFKTENNL